MLQRIKPYKLLIWLALLLLAGTCASSAVTWWMARANLTRTVIEKSLPATSGELASSLELDIARAVNLAASSGDDAALREWLADDEREDRPAVSVMSPVRGGERSAFRYVVSEREQRYWDSQGTVRGLNPERMSDAWYGAARSATTSFTVALVPDPGSEAAPMVLVSRRLVGADQRLLGVSGLALPATAFFETMNRHTADGAQAVYFVDAQGKILYSDAKSNRVGNLHQIDGLAAQADRLLGAGAVRGAAFERSGVRYLASSRFVPALDWNLIVEQNPAALEQTVWPMVLAVGAIGLGTLALVLIVTGMTIAGYQERMRALAGKDSMTGLLNRQSFTRSFQEAALEMQRLKLPMSLVLFDIDFLKKINASHGHSNGDRIIREIARLSRRSVRGSDLVCRWGGEQFGLLLQRCELEQAYKVAEQLRLNVQNHEFDIESAETSVTISLGVAEWNREETMDELFSRVDQAVFLAKSEGRNRAQIAHHT